MPLPLRIAPLITYAGAFAAWPGTLVPGDRKAPDGCTAQSEGALMLGGRGESNTTLGQIIGTSRQLVSMWVSGARFPADEHLETMEVKLGIPALAWQLWRSSASPPAPETAAPPPEAKHRDVEAPPAGGSMGRPTGAESTVIEKARALLADLSGSVLTSDEIAQKRMILQVLTLEARLAGEMMATSKAKLHDHPDWPAVVDVIGVALRGFPEALEALHLELARVLDGDEA